MFTKMTNLSRDDVIDFFKLLNPFMPLSNDTDVRLCDNLGAISILVLGPKDRLLFLQFEVVSLLSVCCLE